MIKIILILFSVLTYLSSAVIQTNLQNGLWQFVGFSGSHLADSSVAYQGDISREIIDIADKNTTYLVKENDSDNGQLAYIRNDYTLSTSYISITTKLRSSIGIFAIKNSLSPSGKTTLKTNLASAVKLKVKDAKAYSPNMPNYRMYVKGKYAPILRIDYQADYEGHPFRIKFANETEDYIAYFDNSRTFANATVLESSSSSNLDASAYSASIRDSIDFNSNDNNLTKMSLNQFEVKDGSDNYNKDLTDYASSDDFNVIVYRFKNGEWDLFNSLNSAESNAFDSFDIGQGYWIKINNDRTVWSLGISQTALISRDSLKIDMDYSKLKNGWNIMSFSDTYIRYSPTGVFIPQAIINNTSSTISIHRLNRSGRERHSISIPKFLFTSVYSPSSVSSSARLINIYANQQENLFGYKDKIRAVPAIKIEDNGNKMSGIIVISDSKFEINSSGSALYPITTISGQSLNGVSSSSNFETVYGEYVNFLNVNELNETDINVSLSLRVPKYSSSPLLVSDLNDTNKTQNALNILTSINTLATKVGETTPSTSSAIYLTTLNFNSDTDYNISNNHDSILISSGTRFSVSDATYAKVYKFNRNGKFKLTSSDGSRDIDSGTTNNIDTLITNINNVKTVTGVTATSLGTNSDGDSQFVLTSTKKGIRISENDSINLFDDISLTSSSISSPDLAKGSIKSTHTFKDLLDADIVFNNDAIDGVGDFGNIDFDTDILTTISDANFITNMAASTADTPYLVDGDLQIDITMGAGPTEVNAVGSVGIISGNVTTGGSLFISGTLIVGGDLSVGGAGRMRVYGTGSLIVKGNAYMEHFEFPSNGQGRVDIGGELFEKDPGSRTGVAEVLAIHKTLPSIAQQQGAGHLDINISGVPVGLFDLKGQAFPNTSPDLKSNPSPTLDFPISGGIIEAFYEDKKQINTIMTMEYSSSNQGFWKITDLTKNIDTLYGNSYDNDDEFDDDYQGIFHLYSNKAYWVNVDKANTDLRPDNINKVIALNNSKVTMQSYTHFSNTFDKGVSTTQNHINHRLNIKFTDSFIPTSGIGKDYYNVVAIIKGQRYYLKRNGSYFSLDINDNDMPLLEKVIGKNKIQEKDEPIILEVYDGTGLAFKEMSSNAHFKIKYFKPQIPSFTWNEDNDLIIDDINQKDIDNNISILELFTRSVSDIKSERDKSLLSENNLSKNTDKLLSWEYDDDENLHGGLIAIKAVIKKLDDGKKVSFYSDIKAFLYAPLKKGHKLETNSTNQADTKPYSYKQKKELSRDNGVQLASINKNNRNISMVYYPQGEEGIKSLQGTGFGASRTMFLRVNTGATSKNAIANIKYIPEYVGKIFYIYFDNKLYQGRFINDDRFSNDSSAYDLEGVSISPDTFINSGASQADDTSGRIIEGTQGI